MNITSDTILAAYAAKGYTTSDFNIGGIRFYDNIDKFTDIRFVMYKQNDAWTVWTCNCTTKPSSFALLHPENAEGTSTLETGQIIDNWEIGFHKGVNEPSHRALVQTSKGLSVYRDIEHDGVIHYDSAHLKNDGAGINLHGTYNYPPNTEPPSVYSWSFGCQVIATQENQMAFMDLCDNSGLKLFTYTLFSHVDFPA